MKFKIGDRIEAVFRCDQVPFKATIVEILGDRFTYIRDNRDHRSPFFWYENEFGWIKKIEEKEMNKLDNLKAGDVITDGYVNLKILSNTYVTINSVRCDVFITRDTELTLEEAELQAWTVRELIDYNYEIVKEVKEMTVAEIAKELGHDVKVIEG